MPIGKEQRAVNALKNMNLKPNENDSEKEPYKRDRELADLLGISNQNVNIARRNMIFARKFGIDIDSHVVYAWRWCSDKKHAKIGVSRGIRLRERMVTTYHPTDSIFLIGVVHFKNKKEAQEKEKNILHELDRTLHNREWVKIDESFNNLINKEFTKIGELYISEDL